MSAPGSSESSSREIPSLRGKCFKREADLIARGKGANITEQLKKAWQAEIDRFKDMVREEVIID